MPRTMPMPGTVLTVQRPGHAASAITTAAAVRNRLSRDAGSSHFQAKFISWSRRTRGSVPRIHTKMNTKMNALSRNHSRPATQSRPR